LRVFGNLGIMLFRDHFEETGNKGTRRNFSFGDAIEIGEFCQRERGDG